MTKPTTEKKWPPRVWVAVCEKRTTSAENIFRFPAYSAEVLYSEESTTPYLSLSESLDREERAAQRAREQERHELAKGLQLTIDWPFCPECGSVKNLNLSELEKDHRVCGDCGQEWVVSIDYSEVVRRHLSDHKLRSAQPKAEAQEKV